MGNLACDRWHSLEQVGKGENLCDSLGKEIYKLLKVKERPLRAVSATAADCAIVTNKPKSHWLKLTKSYLLPELQAHCRVAEDIVPNCLFSGMQANRATTTYNVSGHYGREKKGQIMHLFLQASHWK